MLLVLVGLIPSMIMLLTVITEKKVNFFVKVLLKFIRNKLFCVVIVLFCVCS